MHTAPAELVRTVHTEAITPDRRWLGVGLAVAALVALAFASLRASAVRCDHGDAPSACVDSAAGPAAVDLGNGL
jgi:hypothetical protein